MEIIISNSQQGTPEWKIDRAGKVTGSRAAAVKAKPRANAIGKESITRMNYKMQLVEERVSGKPVENTFATKAMKWGTAYESIARNAYMERTGIEVRQTGFISALGLPVGCSLDGDTSNFTGIQEIKCPQSNTHLATIQSGRVPASNRAQIIHNMWTSNAQWCDFISFDPRQPEDTRLFIKRVWRNNVLNKMIEDYANEVRHFLAEVSHLEKLYRGMQ